MSRTVLRLFAAVLLALTIPIQGMAAVMAGQCMALGHHQNATDHGGHGHAQDGHDGYDHPGQSHSSEAAGNAHDDQGGKHCGPCTACCASATIAAANDVSLPTSPSIAPYAFWQVPPLGDRPDALDRPPLAL